jgi:hypothetical protein
MSSWLPVFIIIAALLTLGVLFLGIAGFVAGGKFNSRWGNKLMQARVGIQLVAVLLLMLMFYLAGRG